MLNDRDLLLVDQRGTGKSNALRCHFFSPDNPAESLQYLFPPARVESCAKELATHAELTQYSYQRFADDLEKVRQNSRLRAAKSVCRILRHASSAGIRKSVPQQRSDHLPRKRRAH